MIFALVLGWYLLPCWMLSMNEILYDHTKG